METSTKAREEGVYFLSLSLENVRCFAGQQTLELSDGNGRPAQWTVILGDNGTGKTTLLEVLEKYNLLDYGSEIYSLPKNNSKYFNVVYEFASENTLDNQLGTFFHESARKEINIGTSGFYTPVDYLKCLRSGKFKIYAYKATRKLSKNKPMSSGEKTFYEMGINNDSDELINAEEWLRETDYIASKASDIQESYKKRVEIIKDILIKLLPDVEDIRISVPNEKSPLPRVEFKTPDGWLMLFQLSLGYQTMIAWMVDLAAQLFNEYPHSPNPIAEPAVVLIDEIDLHLHPKWQRTIMSYLSERFINTQFIVTAHSPLIVQAAENANIVVLKREANGVSIHQQDKDVQGWRIDQLLTSDLFDLGSARSPHYEKLLEHRRQILSQAELTDQDHLQLKALETEIGDLPTAETAEDINAMNIIRRAAQLLKEKA
ncbi:MAG: AAA family ATPase [Methylococcales bacterium]|nr:AAA family ATPase [Methylococcales bacterium]